MAPTISAPIRSLNCILIPSAPFAVIPTSGIAAIRPWAIACFSCMASLLRVVDHFGLGERIALAQVLLGQPDRLGQIVNALILAGVVALPEQTPVDRHVVHEQVRVQRDKLAVGAARRAFEELVPVERGRIRTPVAELAVVRKANPVQALGEAAFNWVVVRLQRTEHVGAETRKPALSALALDQRLA